MVKENKSKAIVEYLIVLSVLLTSGAGEIKSIIILVVAAVIAYFFYAQVSIHNLSVASLLSFFLVVNSFLNASLNIDTKEFVIYILRFFCIAILCTCISLEDFNIKYCYILYFLAINSLIWHTVVNVFPGIHLPFAVNRYSTFYHVYYMNSAWIGRNCGIFWEPGVYQIYLNIAVAYLLFGGYFDIKQAKVKRMLVVLIVAVITTKSSMGYLCLFILLALAILSKKLNVNNRIKSLIIISIIVLIVVEISQGIVINKLVFFTRYSAASRLDDLIIGIRMALDYPVQGIGLATNTKGLYLRYAMAHQTFYRGRVTDYTHSNGLINMIVMSGIPFAIIYIRMLIKQIKRIYGLENYGFAAMLVVYFLLMVNEPVMWMPYWITCFYKFKESKACY